MMAKDAVATMGDILPDDASGRDAVHVAVVSVMATEKLQPGQDIGIGELRGRDYVASTASKNIGIVDPFLKLCVSPGERCWLYLYPRSITGLNHHWTHPAFPAEDKPASSYVPPSAKLISEQWLRDFCTSADCPGYDTVMRVIENGRINDGDDFSGRIDGEYIHFNGSDAHGEIPPEFWVHVQNVLGYEPKQKPIYFSCSC